MNDDLAFFAHADTLRAHAGHVFERQMHNAAFARGHGIQAEGLFRGLHAFRSHTSGHFQLFKAQRAVAAAIDMNFFVVRRLQAQRPAKPAPADQGIDRAGQPVWVDQPWLQSLDDDSARGDRTWAGQLDCQ